MTHHPHFFADRIVNIAVAGPLARLELAALAPPKEGDKPSLIPTQTLVMPLDGFLQSFSMIEAVVKKMIAEGVLTPRPTDALPPQTRQ